MNKYKLLLTDWLLENYPNDEEREAVYNDLCERMVEENAYYDDNRIYHVIMGLVNEEDVADNYFRNCDKHPLCAYIYKFNNIYILVENETSFDDSPIFTNLEEADENLRKLENSLHPTIELQMDDFYENIGSLPESLRVEPKREYYNSGYFYSFNIYYNDDLILDGTFRLNTDEVKQIISDYEELKNQLLIYEIHIDSIRKSKDQIGFERYYNVRFSKSINGYDETIEKTIHVPGITQGRTKCTKNFIDIDEIISDFEEIEKENIEA